MPKTILVDFDGVIHKYSKGWQDGSIYDLPIKGVQNALRSLITLGYDIEIFSTRCNSKTQRNEMIKWLDDNDIPYTRIYNGEGKPLASAIIDDNAVRFEGNWEITLSTLLYHLNKS